MEKKEFTLEQIKQVELELLQTATHKSTHTSTEHMLAFYKTFDEVKMNKYDGLIITGAPVEQMEFEEVDYWEELCEIMEWSKTHVTSTFHICWGAQAGLYYHYVYFRGSFILLQTENHSNNAPQLFSQRLHQHP